MPMYGKNHYNIVISLQLIQINEKKKRERIRSIISKRKKKMFHFIVFTSTLSSNCWVNCSVMYMANLQPPELFFTSW